ncbi:MAG: hypothetical protein EOL93_05820 [Epsilonproteobacteria bacterium]|nr:hypothetical protein [Campylobacterota bacterium]
MARKNIEPFNPWPSFVDLFASVIMVVLMFMFVLILNITYYAQFKYKISYTGSVAVKDITEQSISLATEKKSPSVIEKAPKEKDDNSTKDLESIAGIDLTITDSNLTRQENIIYEDWMVIKYLDKEVILDPQSLKDVEMFIEKAKSKYGNHFISIYSHEPQNQISASVAKQIALSRTLNIRNLVRKKGYKEEDVIVRLKEKIPDAKLTNHEAGYGILMINKKK